MAVFGSMATDIYLPSSDIDLVVRVDVDGDRGDDGGGGESPSLDPLRRIHDAQLVGWGGDGTLGYLVIIENAKVPIVKFTHGPRGWTWT